MSANFYKIVKYLILPFLVSILYSSLQSIMGQFFCFNMVIQTVILDVFMGVFCLIIYFRFLKVDYQKCSARDCHIFIWFAIVFVAFLLGQCAAASIYDVMGDSAFDSYSYQMDNVTTGWYLVLTLIIAPVFEESCYRGIWYRCFRKSKFPVWIAMCLSGCVFAMMHGTLIHIIPTFLLSCVCCLVYEYTGRIFMSILLHAANNLFVIWLGGISLPDIFFHPLFLVISIGIFSGCMFCIGMSLQERKKVLDFK